MTGWISVLGNRQIGKVKDGLGAVTRSPAFVDTPHSMAKTSHHVPTLQEEETRGGVL